MVAEYSSNENRASRYRYFNDLDEQKHSVPDELCIDPNAAVKEEISRGEDSMNRVAAQYTIQFMLDHMGGYHASKLLGRDVFPSDKNVIEAVRRLQADINLKRHILHKAPIKEDGIFGMKTMMALKSADPKRYVYLSDHSVDKDAANDEKSLPVEEQLKSLFFEMPELTLMMKDIKDDTPENFSASLITNIKDAKKGLVNYLEENSAMALAKSPASLVQKLTADVAQFIAEIKTNCDAMIKIAEENSQKPIEEQKKSLRDSGRKLVSTLASNAGVMQSFVPFKLEDGFKSINKHIMNPLGIPFYQSERTGSFFVTE